MHAAVLPQDEIGLHVHPWKSLMERAGVPYRMGQSVFGEDTALEDCSRDCGVAFPLNAYDSAEVAKVVQFSQDTLVAHHFPKPTSFRAGAFMADQGVFEALTQTGVARESSAFPAEIFERTSLLQLDHGWPNPAEHNENFYKKLVKLWPFVGSDAQPYVALTANGPLVEIPFNGTMVDYHANAYVVDWQYAAYPSDARVMQSMLDVYQSVRDHKRRSPKQEVVLAFGFHQEFAQAYLPMLEHFLALLTEPAAVPGGSRKSKAALDGIQLESVTTAELSVP
jgi:hypothetical protein